MHESSTYRNVFNLPEDCQVEIQDTDRYVSLLSDEYMMSLIPENPVSVVEFDSLFCNNARKAACTIFNRQTGSAY